MGAVTYIVLARDPDAAPPDAPVTGLTPTWAFIKKLSDGSDVSPQPTIAEVGFGQYKLSYDAAASGEASGQVDFGSSIADAGARYVDVAFFKNDVITSRDPAGTAGDGSVTVDHNYGGTDAIRVLDLTSAPVDDATIRAYLSTSYAAGNTSGTYEVARATTGVDGRWTGPMMLDPADYTLVVSKQGDFVAQTVQLTVTPG